MAPWPCTAFPRDREDVKLMSVFRNNKEYVCRTFADRQRNIEYFSPDSEIFSCKICGDLICTPYHVYVNCFIFEENASFSMILKYKKTFYRACYIHFKIEGRRLAGRNVHKYADPSGSSNPTARGRGSRGSRGGRGRGRSSYWRGTHRPTIFS